MKPIEFSSPSNFRFNIRVYGIMIENGNILLSDEFFNGIQMTKFPGGGLDYGEGTVDCLKREVREEFNCSVDVLEHYYTTDYFQAALFYENTQLISIYYIIKIHNLPDVPVKLDPYIVDNQVSQYLRWVPLSQLNVEQLTFPIDRKVAAMLKQQV